MKSKWNRGLRIMMISILIFMMSGVSALAAAIPSVIITNGAPVYQYCSTKSRYVRVRSGLKVNVVDYSNKGGWAKITNGRYVGYIALKHLNRLNPPKAYVAKNTKVYQYASTSSRSLNVGMGTVIYVLGADGGFTRVANSKGSVIAYIPTSEITYTKPQAPAAPAPAPAPVVPSAPSTNSGNAKIEQVIAVAQSLMDKPYAEDSNPPQSFDCATFTHYCYDTAQKGLLTSSAKAQGYDDRMASIPLGSLKRGDLVCFNTNEDDSDYSDHVGIYLGDGNFIHASSSAGKVTVNNLTFGYYQRTFSCGRRVFN